MAISETVDLKPAQLWPQGDARDPLGVWGARHLITGDASGGSVKVAIRAAASIAGAFLFTCYSAVITDSTVNLNVPGKCRLLTNWPDIDDDPGVQGYGSFVNRQIAGGANFTAPISGPDDPFINGPDRFILLFDPRPVVGAFNILELELDVNTLASNYSFEAWGYYWDRGVLNAPGGPRHPGGN